jgi:TPR repeat protein
MVERLRQKNYLCALKWYLKAIGQVHYNNIHNNIRLSFENGRGVPLDKYKALEWYFHGVRNSNINRLKRQGYHWSATDKSKLNSVSNSLY